MKIVRLFILSIIALLVLSACGDEGFFGATFITEGEHRMVSGERMHGELLVTGGDVLLEPGTTVSGSVHMFGGSLTMGGTVGGNVSIVSGDTILLPDAHIAGDLVHSGGSLDRARDATIGGSTTMSGAEALPLGTAWESRTIAARLQTLAITAIIPMAFAYVALPSVHAPSPGSATRSPTIPSSADRSVCSPGLLDWCWVHSWSSRSC